MFSISEQRVGREAAVQRPNIAAVRNHVHFQKARAQKQPFLEARGHDVLTWEAPPGPGSRTVDICSGGRADEDSGPGS